MSRRHVVGFALLTLILIVAALGWSLYRHRATAPQRQAWLELTDRLRAEKAQIDSLEAVLARGRRQVAGHRARLDSLEGRISAFERRAVDGRLPRPQHQAYLELIAEQNEVAAAHNAALADVQAVYDGYAGLVRSHNAVIDSANRLRRAAAEEGIRLEEVELR